MPNIIEEGKNSTIIQNSERRATTCTRSSEIAHHLSFSSAFSSPEFFSIWMTTKSACLPNQYIIQTIIYRIYRLNISYGENASNTCT